MNIPKFLPIFSIFLNFLIIFINAGAGPSKAIKNNKSIEKAIARTQNGRVQGEILSTEGNDIYVVYRGIPYAQPPVGNLRWREPQPLKDVEKGIKNATKFQSKCVQLDGTGSENCLYLNIWTTANCDAKRPVYVWIHGGMFGVGNGSDPRFDGLQLAKKGLTVVTINYRLGLFGFMAHPDLNAESGAKNSSGMYGIMDQIAALEWVKANIANFGGDPSKVTIGGQSAGAGSVLILLQSPPARGLFQRAISESGISYPRDPDIFALPDSYRNVTAGVQDTMDLMEAKNVSTIREMRGMTATELMNGTATLTAGPTNLDTGFPQIPIWRPVFPDGHVMPKTYWEAMSTGQHVDMPLMTGTTKDEFGATPFGNTTTLAAYKTWAQAHFGDKYSQFWKLYNASDDASAGATRNIEQHHSTLLSTYEWAMLYKKTAKSPVYRYIWTTTPPGDEARGAHHSAEIQYFFDSLDATPSTKWTDLDRQIAAITSQYVANFVKTGNPNIGGGDANLTEWTATSEKVQNVMVLGNSFEMAQIAPKKNVAFFRSYFAAQKPY